MAILLDLVLFEDNCLCGVPAGSVGKVRLSIPNPQIYFCKGISAKNGKRVDSDSIIEEKIKNAILRKHTHNKEYIQLGEIEIPDFLEPKQESITAYQLYNVYKKRE